MNRIYCARSLLAGAMLLMVWDLGVAQEKQAEKEAPVAQDAGPTGIVQIQMRRR
jgi:hypothetical protein